MFLMVKNHVAIGCNNEVVCGPIIYTVVIFLSDVKNCLCSKSIDTLMLLYDSFFQFVPWPLKAPTNIFTKLNGIVFESVQNS